MRTLLSKVTNSLGTSLGGLAVFLGPLTTQATASGQLPDSYASLAVLYSVVLGLLIVAFGLRFLGASIGSVEDGDRK